MIEDECVTSRDPAHLVASPGSSDKNEDGYSDGKLIELLSDSHFY